MGECGFCDINAETGFVEDKGILFLVKFGQTCHLKQIVDGDMRFSPSQKYVEQEKLLHDKGQGDLLEGKMKLKVNSAKMFHPETNELLYEFNKPTEILISIQDVNDMPIVCFLTGAVTDCSEYVATNDYAIKFSDDVINAVNHDFHKPESALIILEPLAFIQDMKRRLNAIASSIRYYDYSIQTLQQYRFLCSGDEYGSVGTMVYENRYRHLLCKDIAFKQQKEYRFIKLDELIAAPKQYKFSFNYEHRLVDCDELFSGLHIKR